MPDEHGNPMAGEWWKTRGGGRAYVSASQNAGEMRCSEHSELVGWSMADGTISGRSWSREGAWFSGNVGAHDLVKHLPDCTGWDWQAPDWVELDPVNYGWHKLRYGIDQCRHVNCHNWEFVEAFSLTNWLIEKKKGNWQFRCLRKDLPVKPPEPAKPELWNPTSEEKVLLWGAIHNMQAAIGRIEAQLRADKDRDKFFESGL